MESRKFSASEKSIFEIDFSDRTGFQKQNCRFFARRYPLPNESDFLKIPVMLFHGYITIFPSLIM